MRRAQAARPNVTLNTLISVSTETVARPRVMNAMLPRASKDALSGQRPQRRRQRARAPAFSRLAACSAAGASAQIASSLTSSRALLRDSRDNPQRRSAKSKAVPEPAPDDESARALLGHTQHEPTGSSFITRYGEGRNTDAQNLRCALQRCTERIELCPMQDDVPHTPLSHAAAGRRCQRRQRRGASAHTHARAASSRLGRVLEWRASAEARDVYLDHLQLQAERRNGKRCAELSNALDLGAGAVVAWYDSRHREAAAHEAEVQAVADAEFAAAHPLAVVMARERAAMVAGHG